MRRSAEPHPASQGRRLPLALGLLLAASSASAGEAPRFRIERATVQAPPATPDGRFAVLARVAAAPVGQGSARFDTTARLKSTAASCGPVDVRVFANGFEGP
jgi:hypothetical protein